MRKLRRIDHLNYLASRARWRCADFVSRKLSSPGLMGIAGAYSNGNAGDAIMGTILQSILEERLDVRTRKIAVSWVDSYRSLSAVICGGGELGDESYFEKVFRAASPDCVYVIGTSPSYALGSAASEVLRKLRRVNFICVRNRWAQTMLCDLLERDNIRYAPDIVFSAPRIYPQAFGKRTHINRAAINVIPFYLDIKYNGRLFPSTSAKEMLFHVDPQVAQKFDTISVSYMNLIECCIWKLLDQYDYVDIIPFSVGDEVYSKSFFCNRKRVSVMPYTASVEGLVANLQRCSLFVATRFHAHVLGLITGTPMLSICYASKCLNLLTDLDLASGTDLVSRADVATRPTEELLEKMFSTPILLSQAAVKNLANESYASLEALCNSIIENDFR